MRVVRLLLLICGVGLALRLLSAWFTPGYFAADDYSYAIEMAWWWLQNPEMGFRSLIRSPFFSRWIWALFSTAQWLGLDAPDDRIRFAYAMLGVWSLGAILGAYALGRQAFGTKVGLVAAALMAVHGVMPDLSTRALIEMVCAVPLCWGLWAAEVARRRALLPAVSASADSVSSTGRMGRMGRIGRIGRIGRNTARQALAWGLLAGALLGLASMLRFQVGLIYITVFGLVLWRSRWSALGMFVSGLAALTAQFALDWHVHGPWELSPMRYIRFNIEHASSFGVHPWYTYFGIFGLLLLPPIGFAFLPGWLRAARTAVRRHAPLLFGGAVFVLVHSAVEHKEERFMFPVVALFFVLLAAAMVQARRSSFAPGWQRHAVPAFWALNLGVLAVAVTSDSYLNITQPLREVYQKGGYSRVMVVGDYYTPAYYLGSSTALMRAPTLDEGKSQFSKLAQELGARREGKPAKVRLVFDHHPTPVWAQQVVPWPDGTQVTCSEPRQSSGSVTDRLLVWVNPDGNRHRQPRVVVDCTIQKPSGGVPGTASTAGLQPSTTPPPAQSLPDAWAYGDHGTGLAAHMLAVVR